MSPDPNCSSAGASGSGKEATVKVPAKDPKKKDDKKDEDLVNCFGSISLGLCCLLFLCKDFERSEIGNNCFPGKVRNFIN